MLWYPPIPSAIEYFERNHDYILQENLAFLTYQIDDAAQEKHIADEIRQTKHPMDRISQQEFVVVFRFMESGFFLLKFCFFSSALLFVAFFASSGLRRPVGRWR